MPSKSVYLKFFARTQNVFRVLEKFPVYFRSPQLAICQARKVVEWNILIGTSFNPEGLTFRKRNVDLTLKITTTCHFEK